MRDYSAEILLESFLQEAIVSAVLTCIRAYFGIPVAFSCKHILLGSLCYDAIKLFMELFDFFIFMV